MDQIIPVIEQNPLGILIALDAIRVLAKLFELDLDFVRNRLNLPGVSATGDHEKVGKSGDFAEVENPDILGLFCLGCLRHCQP